MKYYLAHGWYLQRIEINCAFEWVFCDPCGDRLGNTAKHKDELDAAMMALQGHASSDCLTIKPINAPISDSELIAMAGAVLCA